MKTLPSLAALFILTALFWATPARPDTVFLPANGDTVVGSLGVTTSEYQDTLLDIGLAYDQGYQEMRLANPKVDPWIPGAETEVMIPSQYILPPDIMVTLENTRQGTGGEIQLTDAIAKLLTKRTVLSLEFEGKRYDCGSKLGYLQATVEYALEHPELRQDFGRYLHGLMAERLSPAQRKAG